MMRTLLNMARAKYIRAESDLTAFAATTSTPAVGFSGLRARLTSIPAIVSDALFFLLVAVDIVRTLRHAMWRDELQSFMLASASSSIWDLFLKVKLEAHPGLWYMLVWLLTRVTSDPMWMQVMHIALAVGTWVIIYRWSPFGRAEKILILLSYFLFWEYFVISRSYVLLALIGFAFVALRQYRPRQRFIPWLLLGLLANVHVFGAIWSMALGASLALQSVRRNSAQLAGVAVYLALFGLAIATMVPPRYYWVSRADVVYDSPRAPGAIRLEVSRFNQSLEVPLGAFVPLQLESVRNTFVFLADPGHATVPQFYNTNPLYGGYPVTDYPLWLALLFAVPVAACWLITRNWLRVLEFFLVYAGVILFTNMWNYIGNARTDGVLFLALLASVWTARARSAPPVWSSWLLVGLLVINACAGVLTLASELQPFSQARNTAAWIKQNNLADAFLIGSEDAEVSSVAGYLGRPVYYLECECYGTFIIWNEKRQSPLSREEFGRRLSRAVGLAEQREAILIRNRPVVPEDLGSNVSSLAVRLLKTLAGATRPDESYWIYRVIKTPLP